MSKLTLKLILAHIDEAGRLNHIGREIVHHFGFFPRFPFTPIPFVSQIAVSVNVRLSVFPSATSSYCRRGFPYSYKLLSKAHLRTRKRLRK